MKIDLQYVTIHDAQTPIHANLYMSNINPQQVKNL